MSRVLVKPGAVFIEITPALLRILNVLGEIAAAGVAMVPGLPDELVITSVNDSTHSPNSRHYRNEAVDVRSKSFPNRAVKDLFRMRAQALLGDRFTVLFESAGTENEHFHIQVRKGVSYS